LITEHGAFCNDHGEFSCEQFQKVMRGELKRFAQRQITNAMNETESKELKSIMLMLKLMDISMSSRTAQASQSGTSNNGNAGDGTLASIIHQAAVSQGALQRIGTMTQRFKARQALKADVQGSVHTPVSAVVGADGVTATEDPKVVFKDAPEDLAREVKQMTGDVRELKADVRDIKALLLQVGVLTIMLFAACTDCPLTPVLHQLLCPCAGTLAVTVYV